MKCATVLNSYEVVLCSEENYQMQSEGIKEIKESMRHTCLLRSIHQHYSIFKAGSNLVRQSLLRWMCLVPGALGLVLG
jgi:hypothetical protein